VLDLACGTGIVTLELLRRFPGARVVGVDLTEDYLAVARRKLERRGRAATLVHGDAETAAVEGPFDAVVASYLPKYVDADRLVAHVTPALGPGGVIAVHDFTLPRATLPRWVWTAYFRVLNPAARRLFPGWDRVFDASLEGLVRRTRWVAAFRRALRRQGYERVTVEPLTFGAAAIVRAVRPRAAER
jgi:demethylmenaquinone methyltransferase/2-methoxy-6-polyprenyl-1,4-benzoquinol methylase